MKVIYFTFLVLFFNYEFSSAGNCLVTCPTQDLTPGSCFSVCVAREKAAAASSSSVTTRNVQSTSSSSKKTTTTKSSKKSDGGVNAEEQACKQKGGDYACTMESCKCNLPQENSSPQSSSVTECGDKQYPTIGGCQDCPGNMTRTVGGKTYCSPNNTSTESESCTVENTSSECLEQRNQECKNSTNSSGSGVQVWSQEEKKCVDPQPTASSTNSYQCIEQFNQMWDKCVSEASSAMTSCNDNNEEMQAAENTAKMIGAGSVASMQVACSKIGELSKFANGALVGWKALCSSNQGGCTDSCTEAKRLLDIDCMEQAPKEALRTQYYKQITDNINQCESYKQKIAQATQHAAAALAQLKASEQCKNDTSAIVNNNVDQCKTNPTSPLCKDLQKCSDANFAAQNPVCACASNPTSPSCLQASANYGSGSNSSGATLPGVGGGKNSSGLPGITGNSNDGGQSSGLGTAGSPATDGHGVGGRQGDASSAGSLKNNAAGGPNGAGNHYGAGANGKDPLKVNSGTLGGTPGGPGYFGRTPGSSGNFGNNAINANKGTLGKFDPRKYISGMGGKGEYINGANQNIFMIVKMRYEDKKTSLLPENFDLKK